MGDYLRALRTAAGLTRADLWERARVSTSHIRDIEAGDQRPTDQTLLALAAGVGAANDQRRHLFAVRDAACDMPPREDVLNHLTAAHRQWLDADDLLLAFFDKRWNYLIGNAAYTQAFPGIAETGHLLKWLFTPAARRVLVDWESEVRTGVDWYRGILCCYRNTDWAADVLAELQGNADFRRHWQGSQLVAFGREDPRLHLRNHDGSPTTINILIASIGPYTVTHIGRPIPYCGPRTWG
jgi:transcriptional regulator with XRE-family HTH domain